MKIKSLIQWFENGFDMEKLALAVVAVLVVWLVGHFGVRLVLHQILRLKKIKPNAKLVLQNMVKPLSTLVYTFGITEILSYLNAPQNVLQLVEQLMLSILAISVGLAMHHFIPALMMSISKVGKDNVFKHNAIIRSFLTTLLQVLMWTFVLVVILGIWHINVNGILAGAGLTGVAISMAAQDQIRNFLGGVVIIGERSFGIGDEVESPSIQGTVEDITFRSTKLRTATGALQVVPNSTLANEPITNVTQLDQPKLNLDYYLSVQTTQQKMTDLQHQLMTALADSECFKENQYHVNFSEITTNGCHVQLGGTLSAKGADDQDQTKMRLNLLVLATVTKLDIQLA